MKKDRVLISIVIVLALSVVFLGWQVFKLKNEREEIYDPQRFFSRNIPYSFSLPHIPHMFGETEDDIFRQMRRIQREIERMFERDFGSFPYFNFHSSTGTGFFSPNIDIRETPEEYVIKVDLPGMDRDKINVEVKGHSLIISGERSRQMVNKGDRFYRQERNFGSFLRVVPLPEDALTDKVSAQYKKGVLVIRIPKAVSPQPSGAKKVSIT